MVDGAGTELPVEFLSSDGPELNGSCSVMSYPRLTLHTTTSTSSDTLGNLSIATVISSAATSDNKLSKQVLRNSLATVEATEYRLELWYEIETN